MIQAKHPAGGTELSARVAEASARCADRYGIRADSPCRMEFLPPRDLEGARKRNADLIQAAQPELERLYRTLGSADYIVSLSDRHAVRLICRSDPAMMADVANYGILPGTIWTEARHGPSSLSLALETGQAVSLCGRQHVPAWMHGLSCTSAPVFSHERSVPAGAVTISTPCQPSGLAMRELQARVECAAARISAAMVQAGRTVAAVRRHKENAPWPGTGIDIHMEAGMAALAAGRPLLILGESGSGKTWLLRRLLEGRSAIWFTEEWWRRDPQPDLSPAAALVLERVDLLPPAIQMRLPELIDGIRARGGAIAVSLPDAAALGGLPPELRFRLGGQRIELAPLRRVPDLRRCLMEVEAGLRVELGLPPAPLPRDTLLALLQYHWPGNGHELQNLLHQALLLCEGGALLPETLPSEILRYHRSHDIRGPSKFEEARIVSALIHNAGNVTRTASYLGVSRATLYRKLALSEWREAVRAGSGRDQGSAR